MTHRYDGLSVFHYIISSTIYNKLYNVCICIIYVYSLLLWDNQDSLIHQ